MVKKWKCTVFGLAWCTDVMRHVFEMPCHATGMPASHGCLKQDVRNCWGTTQHKVLDQAPSLFTGLFVKECAAGPGTFA